MHNTAHVAVLTHKHVFHGILPLPGRRRVSDILNNKLADVVELENVSVYRTADRQTPRYKLPSCILRKQHILLVAILREERDASIKRLVERVKKASARGHTFVGEFHIRGDIIFSGKQKADKYTLRQNDWFIPIRRALISSDAFDIPADIVLVNNAHLAGFHYEETAVTTGQPPRNGHAE